MKRSSNRSAVVLSRDRVLRLYQQESGILRSKAGELVRRAFESLACREGWDGVYWTDNGSAILLKQF
nr:hypothetical protein [Aquitalea sp. S1-19]